MTNALGSFSSRANKGSNHPGVTTTWGSKNIKTLEVAEDGATSPRAFVFYRDFSDTKDVFAMKAIMLDVNH